MSYIKSTGVHWFLISLFSFTVMEACSVATGIWLAYWSSADVTTNQQRDFYLTVYGCIGAGQAFFIFMYSLTLFWGAIQASRTLHRKLIVNILRLPMTFFDTTPLGRIMNRLSKDIYGIDVTIPLCLRSFLQMFFDVLGMLVAVSYATPLFLSIVPPLAALYFYFQVGGNSRNVRQALRQPNPITCIHAKSRGQIHLKQFLLIESRTICYI